MHGFRFQERLLGYAVSAPQNCLQNGALVLLAGIPLFSPFALAQTRQPVTKGSTLLVDTDDTCHPFVDDEDKGVVTPAQSQKFKVNLGDHILKCTIESVPDLVWRKVVSVKDASQVAAVITLKALHLQYSQVVTKVKSQKDEADAAATRNLQEAESEQKQREAAKAEFPQRMFEKVKGVWTGGIDIPVLGSTAHEDYTFEFVGVEDGLVVAFATDVGSGAGLTKKGTFVPEPPNRLVGTGVWQCTQVMGKYFKKWAEPGTPKDKQGWQDCRHVGKGAPNEDTIIVNDYNLEVHGELLEGRIVTLAR